MRNLARALTPSQACDGGMVSQAPEKSVAFDRQRTPQAEPANMRDRSGAGPSRLMATFTGAAGVLLWSFDGLIFRVIDTTVWQALFWRSLGLAVVLIAV